MIRKKILISALFLFLLVSFVSASYNITGYVENAKDGTGANGREVVLWNPLNGQSDNVTDIVGPTGNSGADNIYMMDCELLGSPCQIGDTIHVKVVDEGNGYVSNEVSVQITGAGYDLANNLSLNSPPSSISYFPKEGDFLSGDEINFNCSAQDLDSNLESISLYGNWSGGWHENETKGVSGSEGNVIFTKKLSEGNYRYSCAAKDNSTNFLIYSQNKSFIIDTTLPIITGISSNISSVCGTEKTARIACTTFDSFSGIGNVTLNIKNSYWEKNFSMDFLSGDTYYKDILLNETGIWNYECFSKDKSGNEISLNSSLEVYPQNADLYINSSKISFSKSNPQESEIISFIFYVDNLGCTPANNVNVGFFKDNPGIINNLVDNKTISVSNRSSVRVNFSWISLIGLNKLFAFADYSNLISEPNESNNEGGKNITVNAWQSIYGNITVDKILGKENGNMNLWLNGSNLEGNVFVADTEAEIDWNSLQAIGKTTTGSTSSNDFSEIDSILNMSFFSDSVSYVFSNSQIPKETENFFLHGKNITEVPVINSSENSYFKTGILWDFSDDTNGEFDNIEKEDIVFVTKINKGVSNMDYEIKIPAKIREYYPSDKTEFYLYYDLN